MKFRPLHRPHRDPSRRRGRQEQGRHHHSRHRPEKPAEGEIVAVGPGARDEKGGLVPLDVKKGDRVLFGKWSGSEIKLDGEELIIMNETDVMGVIENAAVPRKKAA
jgi:chaperonin GroES